MKFKLIEELDNSGNELTKEQSNYFRNSKMRDGSDLKIFYNSGSRENREIYNCDKYPYFFTELEAYSKEYGDITYAVYLNITNPFGKINQSEYNLIFNEFVPYCKEHNIEVLGLEDVKIGRYVPFPLVDTLYYYLQSNSSYDGILSEEFGDSSSYFKTFGSKGQISYIPLYANQIKLITNKYPTSSDNIDR